ncbi:MAG: LPXTG cell wall anchor domain-containing protein [Actinomycetota bacterium]|nr:LPXTG cell wall anchor domain-containing protein [Actinomycetota bacterium]
MGTSQGGSSGDATSVKVVQPGSGAPAPSSSAVSGNGGAASASAVSGATGAATATSQCLVTFRAQDLVIHGDLILACYALALAQSGSSGAVLGTAQGGGSGNAYAGGPDSSAAVSPGSNAVASVGAGGSAAASALSGTTGPAVATSSCMFNVFLTRVVIQGQLLLQCIVQALATSGESGAVSVGATTGPLGTASVGGLLGSPGQDPSGSVPAKLADGAGLGLVNALPGGTGGVSATATCGWYADLTDVQILGGFTQLCDKTSSAIPGGAGLVTVTAGSPLVSTPPAKALSALASTATASDLYAVSGDGGSALTRATSGDTGTATALAVCWLSGTASGGTSESVLLSCLATSTAKSGSSGQVTAIAMGGGSGVARAGVVLEVVSDPIPVKLDENPAPAPSPLTPPSQGVLAAYQSLSAVPRVDAAYAGEQLPQTGGAVELLGALGASTMLLGAGLVLVGRRRRDTAS